MMCSTIFFIQLFILPLLLKSLHIFLLVLFKSHVKLDIINQVTHSQVQKHYFVDCHVALWDEAEQLCSSCRKVGTVVLVQLAAELTAQDKVLAFPQPAADLWKLIKDTYLHSFHCIASALHCTLLPTNTN